MNVLLIHAHPEPKSFCTALYRMAIQVLEEQGHQVQTSDLYHQSFNPVASAADFSERRNPDYLTYALEQRHAYESDALAPDIQGEIDKVTASELVILTFPIYWFSTPAILKGWIDRVFVSGLFYGGKRIYDRGGLRGKKALVAVTLGGREHMFGSEGIHGDLNVMLRPLLQGTLAYVGLTVLEPFIAYHVPYLPEEQRREILERWRNYLDHLDKIQVLAMPSLNQYDELLRPISQVSGEYP